MFAEYFSLAISVMRMVKLFGWERKMEKKISDKRSKEIRWVLRGKVIEMTIDDLKYASSILSFGSVNAD